MNYRPGTIVLHRSTNDLYVLLYTCRTTRSIISRGHTWFMLNLTSGKLFKDYPVFLDLYYETVE